MTWHQDTRYNSEDKIMGLISNKGKYMKKIAIWVLAAALLFPGVSLAGNVVEAGNVICPVSGDEVAKGDKAVFVEHNGKKYALCCKMCVKDFKKDPDKFVAKAGEQMKTGEISMESEHAGHAH